MRAGSAHSVALIGIDGTVVQVEAAVGDGLPKTVLVGLPDASLYEARDRCKAAVSASGYAWPTHLLTINLSPATLPKSGSHYDLAIVAAIMVAQGLAPADRTTGCVMLGELGLTGAVRSVRGLLSALQAARTAGFGAAVVPAEQLAEAGLVDGLQLYGVTSLRDLMEVLRGGPGVTAGPAAPEAEDGSAHTPDFAEVNGQDEARWALEVAAAGRHHVLLQGPPGVGKTMLAARLPGILPPLTHAEALEVSAIHSLYGLRVERLIRTPPFSDPHRGATVASVVGGGSRQITPGAISMAHRGVLFLDEAPEFSTRVLESLRTPLESGEVLITRAETKARFPARFQLVLAANPCPCGFYGSVRHNCRCTPHTIRRYQERLSGPMLDRIDIHQTLHQQSPRVMRQRAEGESSAVIAARVARARERQARRLRGTPWTTNAEVPGPVLRELPLPDGFDVLETALRRGQLSPRGVDKVWRVAWTIADLDGSDRITRGHLTTALGMRTDTAAAA
ncbi:YifB family Mg chelatase-like AAA ATPase [Tessaracoccus sp. SD287]|uniref:YifB family Mg chelatase-like AAA ATPase n=1 Tax=Tessaracoccus sp. SD287 TaxID=2782008 RepID=UPI001A97B91B|nr:YifB family Mg chelatase-like AAA ATPase [Tessaracoccus sp. SD287]